MSDTPVESDDDQAMPLASAFVQTLLRLHGPWLTADHAAMALSGFVAAAFQEIPGWLVLAAAEDWSAIDEADGAGADWRQIVAATAAINPAAEVSR